MIVYVLSPNNDSEYVAGTRDQLEISLANTASDEFAETVLRWFDAGHAEPLAIVNGRETETWHVI